MHVRTCEAILSFVLASSMSVYLANVSLSAFEVRLRHSVILSLSQLCISVSTHCTYPWLQRYVCTVLQYVDGVYVACVCLCVKGEMISFW